MPETPQDVVLRIAKAEVGYREGRSAGHWNNDQKYSKEVPGLEWSNRQAWCDTFVHWVALKAGVLSLWPDVAKTAKGGSPGCDITANAWKHAGRWSDYPAVGAQVFFGVPTDLNHTGLVYAYDDTFVYTVEGNTNDSGAREGDGVYLKRHRRRDPNVVGYGYPAYPGGIKSADPAWAKPAKPTTPATPKGAIAVDYSKSHPSPARLAKAGVRGVLRYVSTTAAKNLTAAEARALQAEGLWIGLVWETVAKRAGAGKAAGRTDAINAEKQATAIGYPAGAAIFYAVDYDAAPADVLPYFRGITAEAKRPVGVYGSKRVVEAVMAAALADYAWQTAAWSFHEVATGISFYQHVGTTLDLDGAWDENTILGPKVPVWRPVTTPPPPPPALVTHRVLEANVQQTDPVAAVIARVRALALPADPTLAPDVIVWNELGEGAKGVAIKAAVTALPGFESAFASNVGISWRTARFTKIAVKTTKVNPGVLHITPARDILSVDLEDTTTGKRYRQKGGQSVHHVDVGGKARVKGAITGQNARARKYFATLAAELLADKAVLPVMFCGDLNVDYLSEHRLPAASRTKWFPLTALGTPPVARVFTNGEATHGARLIDWVLLAGHMRGIDQVVLPHGTSDHNPVLTTVAIP